MKFLQLRIFLQVKHGRTKLDAYLFSRACFLLLLAAALLNVALQPQVILLPLGLPMAHITVSLVCQVAQHSCKKVPFACIPSVDSVRQMYLQHGVYTHGLIHLLPTTCHELTVQGREAGSSPHPRS